MRHPDFPVHGMTYYAPLVSALVTLVLTFVLMTGKAGAVVRDIPDERLPLGIPVSQIIGFPGYALTGSLDESGREYQSAGNKKVADA